jgi:formate hydrogenlyase subunit 4
MTTDALILRIIQGSIYLALAPLAIGLLCWAKARLQGRQGPAWFQFYRDLFKLLAKQPAMPANATWVSAVGPALVFSCYAALGFLTPIFYLPLPDASWVGDLLLLVYLLGLARLIMGLVGMSAGASFGGLGSSRELFVHVLIEPTLILIVCVLALKWHTTDLSRIIWEHRAHLVAQLPPSILLLSLPMSLVTLAEAGRLPFDNPATHLELTMFGKAIHLEYSGPDLALLEWAEALRLTFLLILLSNLALPWLIAAAGFGWLENLLWILAWLAKIFILVLALAMWEALQIKVRLRAMLSPAATPLAITLIAALLAIVERFILR